MKKILSVASALILLLASPKMSYADKKGDPELYKTAYSLGADKDYLAVKNYYIDDEHPLNIDSYKDFIYNCNILEAAYYPNNVFRNITSSGACVGISIIEVLSHNGIIKPADIQDGAESLSEIEYNEKTDRFITDYQMIQGYTEFDNYEKYISFNTTYTEKIDKLIETAEKCMENKKYFLIIMRKNTFAHAVCGIGIKDGNWTFNNLNYDKCVLVLDSNAYGINDDSVCFSNEYCIYINSETKQSYVPAYKNKDGAGSSLDYTTIDNDELLNYNGAINPSKNSNIDISEVKHFIFNKKKGIKVIPVYKDGVQGELPTEGAIDLIGYHSFFKADSVHVEIRKPETVGAELRYINSNRWIDIELFNNELLRSEEEIYKYDCDFDFNDNKVSIKNNNPEPLIAVFQIRMNDGTYNFNPYYWWFITFKVTDYLSIEVSENGLLFKSGGGIDATVAPYYYTLNEDGSFRSVNMSVEKDNKAYYLNSDNNVLMSIDNERNISYFIDNKDDAYDIRVQKGDINCDGKIDAVDASKVLSLYAELSTMGNNQINYSLGDVNVDGYIDSVDASKILAEYASTSVNMN